MSLSKYYLRRIIVTGLIASPCYIISETLVLLFFVGLANILPEGSFENVEGWVATLQLLIWILLGVMGWFLSKILIVRPPPKMKEHFCLNQIMDGDYDCNICNPPEAKP